MRTIIGLMLLVAACGDDGVKHLPDGPPGIDAAIDAFVAPRVTVIVTANGSPAGAVPIYFQNADSTVVSATMTDATGTASAEMAAGGFVTAIEPTNVNTGLPTIASDLDTWAGVKPGDVLHLDLFARSSTPTAVTFNVIAPTDPAANNYGLYTSCGYATVDPPAARIPAATTNNLPVQVTLYDCNGVADMLLVTNDINGRLLNSIYTPNVAVADNVDVTIAGPYAPVVDATFSYTNVPASFDNITIQETIATAHAPYVFSNPGYAMVIGGTATGTTQLPGAPGTIGIVRSDAAPTSAGFSGQSIYQWGPLAATYALDVGAVVLPDYAAPPAFDQATHAITWTEGTATTQSADLVYGSYFTFRTGSPVNHSWTWNLVGPRTARTLAYPTVPTDVFDWNPMTSDQLTVNHLANVKLPGGYDAVRAHVFEAVFTSFGHLVVGSTGTIVIEDTSQNIGLRGTPLRR